MPERWSPRRGAISSTSNVFLTGGTLSFASTQAAPTLNGFSGNVIVPYNGSGGINVNTPNAAKVQLGNVSLGFGNDPTGHIQTNLRFSGVQPSKLQTQR
jgi:hypothetical protein